MATNNNSEHRPIESPGGLDLHSQPEKAVRISRRATIGIITLAVLLLLCFAYGGYQRSLTNQIAARDASLPRSVTPATQAGAEFMQSNPAGTTRGHADELRPPGTSAPQTMMVPCGTDPRTGQLYRYNPQTGQPCDGLPLERVVVRQSNAIRSRPITPTPVHEETAEDRRVAEAYPDASSIDLDGMIGLDSHGNAGLRDKVDRHYRRLIGFSVLTSLFTAAFEISQRNSQSALTYPTPAQTAGSAVGQELTQTGAQITRRNLNVQPTIKVPAGYKFTVRVNRDIVFEEPYQTVQVDEPVLVRGKEK